MANEYNRNVTSQSTDSKKPTQMSSREVISVAALVVAAVSWLFGKAVPVADSSINQQILPALTDLGLAPTTEPLPVGLIFQLVGLIAVSAASIVAGKKTTGAGAAVVLGQIFLLGVVFQLFTAKFFGTEPVLLSYAFAAVTGTLLGRWFSHAARKDKQAQTHYYELTLRNRELQEARLSLVKQDEVERRLLAADLHDQVLNDLKKLVESFKKFEAEPDASLGSEIKSGFQKTMTEIREIMDDLCPIMLESFGMAPALEDCLAKASERGGFDQEFRSNVEEEVLERFSMVEQSLLYRLVQESLTNVCKHAEAKNVSVSLSQNGSNLNIQIVDDGKGIDYDSISQHSRGLRYMRLRADLIDAVVEWMPPPAGKARSSTSKSRFRKSPRRKIERRA
jgi:Signal transduction histidine kinase